VPNDAAALALPSGVAVTVWPKDSFHRRIYIQPLGLYLVAEAGALQRVDINFAARTVNVSFEALHEVPTSAVRLRVEQPARSRLLSFQLGATSPQGDLSHEKAERAGVCSSYKPGMGGADRDEGWWQGEAKKGCGLKGLGRQVCIRGAYQLLPQTRTEQSWMLLQWLLLHEHPAGIVAS
jgi:hypothetical protein